MKLNIVFLLFFLFSLKCLYLLLDGGSSKNDPKCFILSVGINNYEGHTLNNSVNDAKSLVEKIIKDNPKLGKDEALKSNNQSRKMLRKNYLGSNNSIAIDTVYTYLLLDQNATYKNIKLAFKEISKLASPDDYFIFYFGGMSHLDSDGNTLLMPYQENDIDWRDIEGTAQKLPVSQMAKLMEKIECNNQIFISEACHGSNFGINLISELFVSDPIVANGTERNRMILTTRGLGYDSFSCQNDTDINHGPLIWYILENENLLNIFEYPDNYEYSLNRTEISCNIFNKNLKYFTLYKEKDFRDILLKNYNDGNTRGGKIINYKNKNSKTRENRIAVLVATNEYYPQSNWQALKNPINDANAVANILKSKYGMQIEKLYNKPRDSVLKSLIRINKSLTEHDQLIVFLAGHGYYSEEFSDGILVFSDSKSLLKDKFFNSYLQMATLNRILDKSKSNNVFLVLDVCFGAITQFQLLLSKLKSQKKLLFVDACYSGLIDTSELASNEVAEVTKDGQTTIKKKSFNAKGAELISSTTKNKVTTKSAFELMQNVFSSFSSSTGLEILTAASGNSVALESSRWQNGSFSYTIKLGLLDYKADTNLNGIVTVNELKEYIFKTVPIITDGVQQPTNRAFNKYLDWDLWY